MSRKGESGLWIYSTVTKITKITCFFLCQIYLMKGKSGEILLVLRDQTKVSFYLVQEARENQPPPTDSSSIKPSHDFNAPLLLSRQHLINSYGTIRRSKVAGQGFYGTDRFHSRDVVGGNDQPVFRINHLRIDLLPHNI